MTTETIKQLSKRLAAECNDLDGLPQPNESHDTDDNRIADLDEAVGYLVDVTPLVSDCAYYMSDLAAIAAECAEAQAKYDADAAYGGGEYDSVEINVSVDDGEETIRFDGGKITVFVTLKIKVDAFKKRDPSPLALMARRF